MNEPLPPSFRPIASNVDVPGVREGESGVACQPMIYGGPKAPSRPGQCVGCNCWVWRPATAPSGFVNICYDCLDDHAPGWDAGLPA